MELEDAIHTAILTLKEGFEGAITESNIESGLRENVKMCSCVLLSRPFHFGHLSAAAARNKSHLHLPLIMRLSPTHRNTAVGIVGKDKKFRLLSAAEVRDYLLEVE
jgi:20S proteasome subunit alpha 2